jgi:hypothetical protein
MATKHISRLPETKGLKSLEELQGMYDSYYLSGKGMRDCLSHTLRKLHIKFDYFREKRKKDITLNFAKQNAKKFCPRSISRKKLIWRE